VCEKNQLLLRVWTDLPHWKCVLPAKLGSCPSWPLGHDRDRSSQYSSWLWRGVAMAVAVSTSLLNVLLIG